MIANLERQEAELNDEIARLESDIENGAGDVSELRRRIAYRCMMQAHRMMKPSQPKRGISGRR